MNNVRRLRAVICRSQAAGHAAHPECWEGRAPALCGLEGGVLSPELRRSEKFTGLQGQYLAFIRAYTLIHRQPPAEVDMQRFFRVTPPAVHGMVLTLEKRGFIERVPGKARSIRLLVPAEDLPPLQEQPLDEKA